MWCKITRNTARIYSKLRKRGILLMANAQQVDSYIMANKKFFPEEKIPYLKEKLASMDNAKFELVTSTRLKDPVVLLVLSLFLGSFGVDRFMLGKIGYGIVKILFCWIFILTIIDLFIIMKKTREYNFNQIALSL